MANELSHETDPQRGKWEKPTDFVFACCGLALKLDIFVLSGSIYFEMGLFAILPYLFYMALFLVPLLVIHSYMGQFSSSGFISAFRLTPLFKGMGYVSVFLSIGSVLYYAIFAIVPLVFIFNSLRPTMPWSCEGLGNEQNLTLCGGSDSEPENGSYYEDFEYVEVQIPSVLFFKQQFGSLEGGFFSEKDVTRFSWTIVGYSVMIWVIVACIFRFFSEAVKFGKLLRYMILVALTLLLVCLTRFLYLPGALDGLASFLRPTGVSIITGSGLMTAVVLHTFGSGWGSIMSLSSFNNFKTNILNYSWIIGFGQILVYILFGLVTFIIQYYFQEMALFNTHLIDQSNWILYLSSASALATLEWSNLWTIIYYSMLFICSLIVMITQIFTVLTSLYDEFDILRYHKKRVTYGLIGFLAFCSLLFCTNHSVSFMHVSLDSIFTHSIMHLLLILAVLWIYGRERFQRDIKFMLGQPFASWKVFMIRFIAPIFLLITLVMGLGLINVIERDSYLSKISPLLVVLPLLIIPGYAVYMLCWPFCGPLLKRACQPTNWGPREMKDLLHYEKVIGQSELTHELHNKINLPERNHAEVVNGNSGTHELHEVTKDNINPYLSRERIIELLNGDGEKNNSGLTIV